MRCATSLLFSAAGAALVLGGCADRAAEPTGPTGPTISVAVAAYDLPSITDACYELTVWNDASPNAGDVVWTQPLLCASQYGVNNGIRYTGICDATAGMNSIRLVLNDVYQGGGGGTPNGTVVSTDGYVNPCPAPGDPEETEDNGCVQQVACVANQDTLVEFNLTVMRQAELGFLDTVVRFSDIFCAAKLDCVDQHDETLHYLHRPDGGDGPSAVLGFTCLSSSEAEVEMYLDDLVVTCRDSGDNITRTATVDPAGGPSNLSGDAIVDPGGVLFGAAVHAGPALQGARYWNVVLGLSLPATAGETCTLTTRGTASESALTFDGDAGHYTLPAASRYPYIDWEVALFDGDGRACGRHPLNGDEAAGEGGVATIYTEIGTAVTFANQLDFPETLTCPCWDAATFSAEVASLTSGGLGTYELSLQSTSDSHLTLWPRGSDEPEEGLRVDVYFAPSVGPRCVYKAPGSSSSVFVDISESEDLKCKDDVLTALGVKRACPCWDPASLQEQVDQVAALFEGLNAEASFSVENLGTDVVQIELNFEFEDDPDPLELDPIMLELRVDGEGDQSACTFRLESGTLEGQEFDWDSLVNLNLAVTPVERAQCAADLLHVADNPCLGDNGGCQDPTPYCVYTGPDSFYCTDEPPDGDD